MAIEGGDVCLVARGDDHLSSPIEAAALIHRHHHRILQLFL
jgi:hypothetical protein